MGALYPIFSARTTQRRLGQLCWEGAMRCGSCKGRHDSVQDARACAGLPPKTPGDSAPPVRATRVPDRVTGRVTGDRTALLGSEVADSSAGGPTTPAKRIAVRSDTPVGESSRKWREKSIAPGDGLDTGVVFMTTSLSGEVYHRRRDCLLLNRGIEHVATRGVLPSEVLECDRGEAQRRGRRPCRSCCPRDWVW